MFSGGIERGQWHEMDYTIGDLANLQYDLTNYNLNHLRLTFTFYRN